MDSEVFAVAAASILCLPSPACDDRIGCRTGNRTVAKYGGNVQAATVEGDGWRTRHDLLKMMIAKPMNWTYVYHQCEVFNRFAHLIPQAGLSRIERGRQRQALVPG